MQSGWYKKLTLDNPRLFVDVLNIRRMKNQDSIIIIVGQKRTGKSWSAIKLAEILDKDFDVKTGLYFKPAEFLKYFNSVEKKVIIFDEGSESYDRRKWWEIQNAVFNSLLTREGFRQNILIITLPVLSDLDQRAVRLSTFLVTMKGYNIDKGYAFGNIYRLFLMDLLGKTRPTGIQNMLFFKASEKNLKKYEAMKMEWNMEKSAENINLLEQLENPETWQKGLKFDNYISMFRKGIIDNNQLKERLIKLNYNETDIDYMINMVEIEKDSITIERQIKQNLLNDGSIELSMNP